VDGLLSSCYALVKKSLLVQVSLYTPLTHWNTVTSFAAHMSDLIYSTG
jgi:hypothetical protein